MKLRADLCLVKLAPVVDRSAGGILLAPALAQPVCYGKVVATGRGVDDVTAGDIVAFGPSVGDPLEGLFPTPHLLVSIRDIDAVIQRTA